MNSQLYRLQSCPFESVLFSRIKLIHTNISIIEKGFTNEQVTLICILSGMRYTCLTRIYIYPYIRAPTYIPVFIYIHIHTHTHTNTHIIIYDVYIKTTYSHPYIMSTYNINILRPHSQLTIYSHSAGMRATTNTPHVDHSCIISNHFLSIQKQNLLSVTLPTDHRWTIITL